MKEIRARLRMSDELIEWLKSQATDHHREFNGEIVTILEQKWQTSRKASKKMAITAEHTQVLESFFKDQKEFAQAVIDAGKLRDHGGYYEIFLYANEYKLYNQLYRGSRAGCTIIGIPAISDENYGDLVNEAGSSTDEALVKELCGESSWLLDGIAEDMREALTEEE